MFSSRSGVYVCTDGCGSSGRTLPPHHWGCQIQWLQVEDLARVGHSLGHTLRVSRSKKPNNFKRLVWAA